jgi:hypothetical protein
MIESTCREEKTQPPAQSIKHQASNHIQIPSSKFKCGVPCVLIIFAFDIHICLDFDACDLVLPLRLVIIRWKPRNIAESHMRENLNLGVSLAAFGASA